MATESGPTVKTPNRNPQDLWVADVSGRGAAVGGNADGIDER
jgi:hypothetical protein